MRILCPSQRSTRRRWSRVAALAVLLLLPASAAAGEDTHLGEKFDAFYAVGLASEGVQLQDFTLRRPDARLVLESGIFVPAEPIDGAVTGGVFLGRGSFSFRPSQEMDREVLSARMQEWLKREGKEYKGEFDGLFLRFSDGTWEEMQKAGKPGAGHDAQQADKIWRDRNGQLDVITGLGPFSYKPFNLEMDFLEKKINALDDHRFFLAEINAGNDGWLTYSYNENYIHEIFFGNHRPLGATVEVHPFTVTSVAGDHDSSGNYVVDKEEDDKLTLDTEHYRMMVTIPNTVHVLMEAAVEFVPRVPVKVVRFDLINNLSLGTVVPWTDRGSPVDVTRVTDGEGNPLPYIHRRHQLLVQYPEPLAAGETAVLAVHADENTIVQLSPESYWLLNTYPWFPQYGFVGGRNTHEWTVKITRPLTAAVSGRLVKEWEEDGLDCTGWVMTEPVQFPSLIFGKFRSEQDVYKSEVSGNDVELRVYAVPQGVVNGVNYSGLKRMKPVLDEAKEILKLFEHLFGPYPYDYLNVAQMALGMGFGQAPPGLVQLTGEAFMSQATLASLSDAKGDFFHEFFAHELAHQWWAHAVWGTSFRDAWLSESFAEYAAGLYVVQLQGENRFQQKIKEWRQNARQAEGRAPLASLMSLGGDMAGSYYQNLIYNKGPYVVHMLRMQMGHDKWVEAMQRFFSKHMHENLTTEALVAELEQSAGYKLDFFFDQWWKGMGIPVFDFSYEIEPTDDGRFLFTGTIRQEGEPVKVLMPVFFHFGGKKVTMEQRPILQAVDVYKAILPERPKKVTLDDHNTLLADIRQ